MECTGNMRGPTIGELPKQAVSRVLFPNRLIRAMAIHLGYLLPGTSSNLPGSFKRATCVDDKHLVAPLFGLALGGVCQAIPITWNTGELLPHHFTLTLRRAKGGIFSVALSLSRVFQDSRC